MAGLIAERQQHRPPEIEKDSVLLKQYVDNFHVIFVHFCVVYLGKLVERRFCRRNMRSHPGDNE